MIKEFVKAWDANKEKLREYISTHEQEDYDSYKKIVTLLFEHVINPYLKEKDDYSYDIGHLHEIDDGNYQGTLLYLVPVDEYEPSSYQYVATFVEYGSCSGCDTLLGISGYDGGMPNKEQVEEYMTLCLHILQHFKYLFEYNE